MSKSFAFLEDIDADYPVEIVNPNTGTKVKIPFGMLLSGIRAAINLYLPDKNEYQSGIPDTSSPDYVYKPTPKKWAMAVNPDTDNLVLATQDPNGGMRFFDTIQDIYDRIAKINPEKFEEMVQMSAYNSRCFKLYYDSVRLIAFPERSTKVPDEAVYYAIMRNASDSRPGTYISGHSEQIGGKTYTEHLISLKTENDLDDQGVAIKIRTPGAGKIFSALENGKQYCVRFFDENKAIISSSFFFAEDVTPFPSVTGSKLISGVLMSSDQRDGDDFYVYQNSDPINDFYFQVFLQEASGNIFIDVTDSPDTEVIGLEAIDTGRVITSSADKFVITVKHSRTVFHGQQLSTPIYFERTYKVGVRPSPYKELRDIVPVFFHDRAGLSGSGNSNILSEKYHVFGVYEDGLILDLSGSVHLDPRKWHVPGLSKAKAETMVITVPQTTSSGSGTVDFRVRTYLKTGIHQQNEYDIITTGDLNGKLTNIEYSIVDYLCYNHDVDYGNIWLEFRAESNLVEENSRKIGGVFVEPTHYRIFDLDRKYIFTMDGKHEQIANTTPYARIDPANGYSFFHEKPLLIEFSKLVGSGSGRTYHVVSLRQYTLRFNSRLTAPSLISAHAPQQNSISANTT